METEMRFKPRGGGGGGGADAVRPTDRPVDIRVGRRSPPQSSQL